MSDEWVLYYWPLAGRGEFVRLVFEEAGVKYKEVNDDLMDLIIKGGLGCFPVFAPPVIKKGDFVLSQTSVICKYLGKKFGLYPETEEDEWHAEQINTTIHDYIAEGRLAFHGKAFVGSYSTQREETKPYIEWFRKDRFARWLKVFEAQLKANNGGNGFVVGNKLTYVDLALYHVLNASEAQFPEDWAAADYIPLLKAFKDRIAGRPNIAAYHRSARWRGFAGDSMM